MRQFLNLVRARKLTGTGLACLKAMNKGSVASGCNRQSELKSQGRKRAAPLACRVFSKVTKRSSESY